MEKEEVYLLPSLLLPSIEEIKSIV